MRIIQITPYYPPHLGGLENCVKEISERLAKKGHRVEVYTSNIGVNNDKLQSNNHLTIHYLKAWEFAHTPLIPSLLFRLLTIPKNSIMHVHVSQAYTPEIAWLISKVRKIPYIAHVHVDIEQTGKIGFLVPFYKKHILKEVLNSASKIIVPTKDYVDIISSKYGVSKNKICEIPIGVNSKIFRKESFLLHNPAKLLYVGRLAKEKNLPLLVESFKQIIDKNTFNLELHIVGEGEEKLRIENMIKELSLEKYVFLHGRLLGKFLYNMYTKSDVFILTSTHETFGIVLIEAMASGTPVIVSDIPGVRNIINNNNTGLLVKLTTDSIVAGIEKLLTTPQLRKKIIKNGLREIEKYRWTKIIPKYICVYKEILHE